MSDWTGSYTSAYDSDGRLSSVINPAGIAITYAYDAVGQRATMAQPTGVFSYVFDRVGRISNLTNPEAQITSWSYDAASRVTQSLLANGVIISNTYDAGDRLLLLANLYASGSTLSSFNYTYNSVGNRTRVIEANGDIVTWSYDPAYQLTNEQRSGANAYNITYVYDGAGNRTLLLNGGAATTSIYNAANELTSSQASGATTNFTYDGSGNLLTTQLPFSSPTTNMWDGENRLTRVALSSSVVNTFTYNGDGQRVGNQESSGVSTFVWDMSNLLLETTTSNVIEVVYALTPSLYANLISQSRGAVNSFYLYDVLGSARQLTNGAGTVTDSYLYDSFGNPIAVSGSTGNRFRFVGQFGYEFNSDLGSYSLRERLYAPGLGRLISRDSTDDEARLPCLQLVPTSMPITTQCATSTRAEITVGKEHDRKSEPGVGGSVPIARPPAELHLGAVARIGSATSSCVGSEMGCRQASVATLVVIRKQRRAASPRQIPGEG